MKQQRLEKEIVELKIKLENKKQVSVLLENNMLQSEQNFESVLFATNNSNLIKKYAELKSSIIFYIQDLKNN